MGEADRTTKPWVAVCPVDALRDGGGACALVEERQVAIFRVGEALYALDNFDPFSDANVLSRGIVGDANGVLKVASPMYKQAFALETGECLSDPAVRVPTYPVRCRDGVVEVTVPAGG